MGDRWTTRGRAALATACGVAALLATPALAEARSHGFSIENRSGSSVRLQTVTTSAAQPFDTVDGIVRRPLAGLLLPPNGDRLDVELAINTPSTPLSTELRFANRQGATFVVKLSSETAGSSEGGEFSVGVATCTVSDTAGLSQCAVDTSDSAHPVITFLDPPGTTRTVKGTEAQTQLSVLWDLCRDKGTGQCSFAGDGAQPEPTFAPTKVIGQPVLNCGDKAVTSKYAVDDTEHSTNSVGIEVGVTLEVEDLITKITASLTASDKFKWGDSKTFAQSYKITVLPRHIAYVALTLPIARQYGTFTAQVNNTVWTLERVSFDTPDPSRAGARPDVIQNRPATAGELAACDGTKAGTKRLRPSAVDRRALAAVRGRA